MTSNDSIQPPLATEKKCSSCGEIKPLEEYPFDNRKKDGRSYTCRVCTRARDKTYVRKTKYVHKPVHPNPIVVNREVDTKICPRCKEEKLYTQFAFAKSKRDGHKSLCRLCENRRQKLYMRTENARRYRAINRIKGSLLTSAKNMGISLHEMERIYNEIIVSQDGKCAICGKAEPQQINKKNKRLCIDHCHVTGKIRGLLCMQCNAGLGLFKDNPDALKNAVLYLQKHQQEG